MLVQMLILLILNFILNNVFFDLIIVFEFLDEFIIHCTFHTFLLNFIEIMMLLFHYKNKEDLNKI